MDATVTPEKRIRWLRQRLQEDPRNALAWLDSALVYTTLGQNLQARRAVETAVAIAGDQRFVVRAACRFYLHVDQPDRAVRILIDSGRSTADPWVAAPLLSATHLAGNSPRGIRKLRVLADESRPGPSTELQSQLATIEMIAGKVRDASRRFSRSLEEPTENTLAQAEWALQRDSTLTDVELKLPELMNRTRDVYEAAARHALATGDFQAALEQAKQWIQYQPFSTEAVNFASYIASVGLGDFSQASSIVIEHRRGDPTDPYLLNNLAFATAAAGDAKSAAAYLAPLDHNFIASNAYLLATSGLIAFKAGNPEQGRRLYGEALRLASTTAPKHDQALIALFWAAEELRLNTDSADAVVSDARKLAAKTTSPLVKRWKEAILEGGRPDS